MRAILRPPRRTSKACGSPRAQHPRRLLAAAEALHLAPAAHREDALQRLFARVDDDAAAARHGAHEVMELALDRREVVEDVGVVELEVVEDRRARSVVDELAALVEEGGVVLVGFDHERRAGIAEARRDAEVERHAADQKAGLEPRLVEDPGQHRRRSGLAVRAGDGEDVAAGEDLLGEPLRPARVGGVGVEDRFDQRVAAHDRVADDEEIRRERELIGVVALDQLDAEGGKLVAHRRVDVGVAAGHPVPGLARERRQSAHERAADAEDVQVHPDDSRERE